MVQVGSEDFTHPTNGSDEIMIEAKNAIASRRPPGVELMKKLGMAPDPWQVEVLESQSRRILLNCSRQAPSGVGLFLWRRFFGR